jgi:hypothetical protein
MTRQGDLFGESHLDEDAPTPVYRADPDEVRRELTALLDQARAGTGAAPPWTGDKARYWLTVFPQMANWLPPAEADRLRAEFLREMRRIEDEAVSATEAAQRQRAIEP